MNLKNLWLPALAVILIGTILVGEFATYSCTAERDSDADWSAGAVTYRVSSSGSDPYDAVLIDNGTPKSIEKLYIYSDENHDRYIDDARRLNSVSSPYRLEQPESARQVILNLEYRGFNNIGTVDSDGLSNIVSGPAEKTGLLVMSYALPSTVYTGKDSDPLMQWISNGGSLYWIGSEIGHFYTDSDGLHEVPDNSTLFFGSEDVICGTKIESGTAVDNGFTEAFHLKNTCVPFGIKTGAITGRTCLPMGYQYDGFSTVAAVSYDNGSLFVFGGNLDYYSTDDMCQIIAAGVTPSSILHDHDSGTVTRGTHEGTMTYAAGGYMRLYIYMGGTYQCYGECHHE